MKKLNKVFKIGMKVKDVDGSIYMIISMREGYIVGKAVIGPNFIISNHYMNSSVKPLLSLKKLFNKL